MFEFLILVVLYVAASYFWLNMDITTKYPKLKDTIVDKVVSYPMLLIGRFL
jgi:hypothetical protein